MRENALKAKWRRGDSTYGCWLTIASSYSAELMAHQGFDWICVDMQHGIIDFQQAVTMLQAISTTDTTPVVRVPWNDFSIINRVLDAGAMGVIIPMVNSVDEARAAVSACRYYPDGARSYGPTRAPLYAGADYYQHANAEVACIPMIETKQAVERLDAILDVPGIDAIYVGPADLSVTLGLPPAPDNAGAFEEARLHIAKTANARGIVAGMHANSSLAAKHRDAGYRMITITSDTLALAARAREDLAQARAAATSEGGDRIY
jgi:4-hydroxy-2-oxoheptanedioate aldolase